jgi:CheY-like chemotaxis protein
MIPHSPPRRIRVLLVEDNEGDIGLIKEALQAAKALVSLHVITDGRASVEYLHTTRLKPHIIILDLNVPGLDGHGILREIKNSPELREIPVIVFTSSHAFKDMKEAYALNANSFVRKPNDVDEFFAAVASIEHFWARTAVLPNA